MLTESYSFVRAQTSHKGEAATWSAYSWIRAWFVASPVARRSALARGVFALLSLRAHTTSKYSIRLVLASALTGARWLMLYDRQQLDRDESYTRWLISMTHRSEMTQRTVCQFNDKIRHNTLTQFAEILVLLHAFQLNECEARSRSSSVLQDVFNLLLLLLLQRTGNTHCRLSKTTLPAYCMLFECTINRCHHWI